MRIFTASLATETNTFSPVPTDRSSFEAAFYAGPGQHPDTPTLCSSPIVALRRRASDEGLTVIEGTATWAEPAGLIRKGAYEELRDEILDQLRAALPVDGVVLGLHGAMVAQDYEDCEGDFLERIRTMVGSDVLIAAEFDPHSHLTQKRLANLDVAAAFLEFPHTDFYERGEHVVELALRALRGAIDPKLSVFDCRMIDIYPTSREPMRSFVDRLKAMEGQGSILSISIIHGFMAGDVPEMGTRILVVTNDDQEGGDRLAEQIGRELFGLRGTTAMPILPYREGIREALATRAAHPEKPVTVADTWDNPGGGCAGDGTFVLQALLETDSKRIAVATIWDPVAVSFCFAAGEGARIAMRFGGKASSDAGPPIDALVEVRKLADPGWQSFRASHVTLGRAAVVRLVGPEFEGRTIDIILITARTQTYEPNAYSNLGIDFAMQDVLLVKSTNHFFAGFEPISSRIIHVDAPSSYPTNPAITHYRKMLRPIWPRVTDPFEE